MVHDLKCLQIKLKVIATGESGEYELIFVQQRRVQVDVKTTLGELREQIRSMYFDRSFDDTIHVVSNIIQGIRLSFTEDMLPIVINNTDFTVGSDTYAHGVYSIHVTPKFLP